MRIAFIALLAGPIAAASNLTTGSMSCKLKASLRLVSTMAKAY